MIISFGELSSRSQNQIFFLQSYKYQVLGGTRDQAILSQSFLDHLKQQQKKKSLKLCFQHKTQIMNKAYTLALTVLAVLLSLLLSTSCLSKAQAEGRSIPHPSSVSSKVSSKSSQVLGDLQAEKKHPQKQVDSSFRRVPPSTSNPIQNK